MPAKDGTGPGPIQELGTQSGSLMWVVGTQWLECSLDASQGARYREAGLGKRPGLYLRRQLWDAVFPVAS